MNHLRNILIICSLILIGLNGVAQNLEGVGKADPLKVSGNLNGGLRFYKAVGIANRNNPFVWTTAGTFNFSFYGVNMPFTFLYSSQNQDFRQPFNRFGISPTYKWITLHLGYRSMEFSPYTMSGNSILGGGIDLKPGKFRFSAVYGRLRTAVAEDTLSSIRVIPSYHRMGYAVKAGYGEANNFIDLTLFKAKDDAASIPPPVKSSITPEDNFVWSLRAVKQIAPNLQVRAEYAMSALNRDIRSEKVNLESNTFYNSLGNFFTPTVSLQITKAIDAAVAYKISNNLGFDLAYQRIDPGYRTLGAYFFNNDREQITINTNISAADNKLQVHAGFGTTRNNLGSTATQALSRRAANVNVSYAINSNLNVSANYSNFHSVINFIFDPLNPIRNPEDTLNIIQVSEGAGTFINYNKKGNGKNHNVSFNANYQGQAPGSGSENKQLTSSDMYNLNLIYRLSLTPTRTSLTLNLNYNQNDFSGGLTKRFGPTLGASQALLKNKLRLTLSSSLFNTYTAGDLVNVTYNTRLISDWRIDKHQSLNTSFSMINRRTKITSSKTPSFDEYIGTVGYNYRF